MADFNALQAIINAYIKRNGVQAITGQILNGVLTGMVNALGKGYTVAGAASPTTDPGTMTGPLAYIAYTAGTYTHFDNIVVEQGEVSMLIYNEAEWHKEVLFSLAAQATVDDNIGVPSVGVSFVDGLLTFDFRNMKGEPGENGQDGDPAGFGTISASISGGVGTPSVSVQSSGPDTAKNIAFQFTNLKGETGVTSCVVTVDNTTGNPSCAVSLVGQELHLDFSGLKGAQGNTGSSVDYPFTIVNNLTTDDATQALSAAMGVQLESEVSQLEAKVTDLTTEGESTRRESTEFVIAYPVTAGGSNGKTINVNLPKGGSYSLLVEDVDTGNTGGFGFDPTPSGSIQGLNGTCTIGKERGFNATANITALTIRDINSSITTSGNMKIVIRSLASNESRINNRDNVELNFSTRLYGCFINGSYSSGNYQTYRAQYRICSQGLLKYDRDVTIKAKAGYKFGVQTFTSGGVYSADSGWVTTYNIPANTYFKFVLTTTNDNVPLGVEDIENIVISTLLDEKTNTGDNSISVTGKGGTGVLTTVSFPSKKVKIKIPSPWPITNVGNVLNNVLTVGYVKGGVSYDLQALTKTEMDSYFEKEFIVIFPEFDFDSTYIFLRADSGATATVEWEEYHDYDLIDSGRNYEGEIIRPKSRFALSQIGQLKNFGTIDETKLNAQGMAVYEDRYILQGSNKVGVGSHLLVVDTKTPSVSMLTVETLSEGQGFHMNNVNLGNKYDTTDTLPLAYCSECYNTHTCKVLRIANDFSSFTEVQIISYGGTAIETTTYDWVVDAERNLLYLISFPASGIKMLCFNLPSTANASVTLTDADVLETINIPNTSGKTILSQGGTIINGKLWTVFGSDTVGYPGFLAVSDIESGKMVSLADLSGLGEAEAVSPYKEGVLLCVASGLVPSGASLKNPSYVYMIFNN